MRAGATPGEVFRNLELARGVPAGLVENDQGVCAGRYGIAYLFEVFGHGFGVGVRHDDRDAGIAAWTDGAEQIGIIIALTLRLPGPLALLRPFGTARTLSPDPPPTLPPTPYLV